MINNKKYDLFSGIFFVTFLLSLPVMVFCAIYSWILGVDNVFMVYIASSFIYLASLFGFVVFANLSLREKERDAHER